MTVNAKPITLGSVTLSPSAPRPQPYALVGKLPQSVLPTPVNAALRGKQLVNGVYSVGRSTLTTTTGSSRSGYTALFGATDLRLTFGNAANNGTLTAPNYIDIDSTAAAVVSASIEINSVIYRVTVNGRISFSVDGGGLVQTDPLPIEVAAGQIIYVRTFVSGTWYPTKTTTVAIGDGGWLVTVDNTAQGAATIPDTDGSLLYMPLAITATPLSAAASALPVVGIVGDSLAQGTGDGGTTTDRPGINVTNPQSGSGGYIWHALTAAGIPSFNAASASDLVAQFVLPADRFRRLAFMRDATSIICEYGRNDVTNGQTLAQIQANLLTAWSLFSNVGLRVFQTTITPKTTSSDLFQTVANQTSGSNESVRLALNAWLRAGSPIQSGAAVAIGTPGAVLAGAATHPLYGFFEIAWLAETAHDSGLWGGAVNVRTVADGSMPAANSVLTSPTAAFSLADLGRQIRVTGAGTAGAVLATYVKQYFSATQVLLANASVGAVAATSVTLGDWATADGTHPTGFTNTILVPGINISQLV